jgi:hypothetical protein
MLFLMLEPRFKSLCLVSSFIGNEEGVNIVEEYNRLSLYPMLLKCYHYLHLTIESKVGCIDQIKDSKFDFDIFEQTPSTSEPTKELVNREMLIFMRYQADSKEIKCHFQWWAKHEAMFPILGFLASQILEIVGSQIELERIFICSGDIYKLDTISFTNRKFRENNICKQEMTK